MHLPTIYTSPSDRPKFDFLQTHNYLGEFKSEVDKARARFNLGIPDEYSFAWGNITGTLDDLADLKLALTQIKSTITSTINPYAVRIDNLETLINTHSSKFSTMEGTVLEILDEISELKTDVSQNATNIKLINTSSGGSGSSYDDTELRSKITGISTTLSQLNVDVATLQSQYNTLNNSISNLGVQVGTINTSLAGYEVRIATNEAKLASFATTIGQVQTDVSGYTNRISNLESKVSSLETKESANETDINTLKSRTTSLETKLSTDESTLSTLSTSVSNLDISVQQAVANVSIHETRIAALEAKVGSISITGIRSNYEGAVLSGTTTSDDVSISILAVYSNNSTTDVTALSSASSSDSSVATYSNGKVSLHNPGNCTITFTYQSYNCSITVKVEAAKETVVQYIGYGEDYTDVFKKHSGYTTIKGTWTSSNTPQLQGDAELYYLWIITTENLTAIQEIGTYSPDDLKAGTETDGDNNYNIYVLGPTESPDLTITIN